MCSLGFPCGMSCISFESSLQNEKEVNQEDGEVVPLGDAGRETELF